MTVIAWDGKVLAADKRATNVGLARTVTKIMRHGKELLGYSGDQSIGADLCEWYITGAKPSDFPGHVRERDDATLLVITQHGAFFYTTSPHPMHVEDKYVSIGSGRDYALAAMHLGQSAREAVKLTCRLDVNCGNGIDTLKLRRTK